MLFVCGLFLTFCVSLEATGKTTSTVTPSPLTTMAAKLSPITTSQSGSNSNKVDASFMAALDTHLFNRNDDSLYYDAAIRPNQFSKLEITAEFQMLGLTKVDENAGIIGVSGMLFMNWVDDRLKWNKTQFGNIQGLMFDGYRIWMPQFMHNGMKQMNYHNQVAKAYVASSGQVTGIMSVNEEIPCRFDMTNFPRDTQTCYMQFYHIDLPVSFKSVGSGIEDTYYSEIFDSFPKHSAWDILNVSLSAFSLDSMKLEENGEILIFSITMKRESVFFVRAYVAPVCFLLLLTPIIFLLPPDSSEKLTYGSVLLFAMIYVSQSVESLYPAYTKTTPYLIKLTTASGALLFLCLLLTSVISSVERIGRKRALPVFIKRDVLRLITENADRKGRVVAVDDICKYPISKPARAINSLNLFTMDHYIVGVVGRYLLVKENDDGLTHGTVHIKPAGEGDRDFIVQNEQSVGFSDERNEDIDVSGTPSLGDGNQALQALVSELRQSRLQSKAQDDWTNLFTILNRFLFLVTLLISIIILLCFA